MKFWTVLLAAIAAGVWCLPAQAQQMRGNGALTAGASALVSGLMTSNSTSKQAYSALGTSVGNLTLINDDATDDAAVCQWGGTCTCPANGVATTNGITIHHGGGGYALYLPFIAYNTITIVACAGSPIIEANW